jgi:hypothetical protein
MFCRDHEAAPAARRGGWLSAYRRRSQTAVAEDPLDASCLSSQSSTARGIWLGGKFAPERPLPGVDVVVLAAAEVQPERLTFGGRIVRARLSPVVDGPGELNSLILAAREVAAALKNRKRVLVTGQHGLERSATVAVLGIAMVTRRSWDQLVALVRTRRSYSCLQHPAHLAIVKRFVRGPK